MLGLVNLDYNFSQRADVGFRLFTLGDNRDESSALNGIAGNSTCVFSGPGPACGLGSPSARAARTKSPIRSSATTSARERELRAEHPRVRRATRARRWDRERCSPTFTRPITTSISRAAAVSPYDVSHLDTRYNEGLSWGRDVRRERVRLRRIRASRSR